MTRLRGRARALGFAGMTLGMLAVAELHRSAASEQRQRAIFERHMRRWASWTLTLFGVRVDVQPPPSPGTRGRLVVANHRSPLDILIALAHFGGHVMSRADLADWPVIGIAAQRAGTIFVDREDRASGARAIREVRRLLSTGRTVTIFAEGGTHPGDEVRPFQGGAFAAARGLDIDLVPVGIAHDPGIEFTEPTLAEHMANVAGRAHTRSVVRVGRPRRPEGASRALASQLRGEVSTLVQQARARWQSER